MGPNGGKMGLDDLALSLNNGHMRFIILPLSECHNIDDLLEAY